MRMPQKKKPGDPVLAADWNMLLDAISARTPMPGAGLELIASSGGFAYSSPTGLLVERQSLPPFAVIGIERSGTNYDVIIKEGWVIERKPKSGDLPTVKFHMPKFGDDKLNQIPRPKIGMSIGDTLWCKYQTDVMGELTEDPEIIVESEDQDGAHYQPDDPEESGVEGDYWVKLFKLEEDDGSPYVKLYQQSDIEHWAQLWTGINLGGGARVYKKHEDYENIFKFRTVRGDYGVNEVETDEEVELDFYAENVGEGCPVWVEPLDGQGQPEADPPDGPAKFRSIDGRESQPQINVECEPVNPGDPLPETIRVVGNEKVGAILLDEGEGVVTELARWDDGLVTTAGETTLKVEEYMVCENGYPKAVKFVVVP